MDFFGSKKAALVNYFDKHWNILQNQKFES